MAEQIKWSQIEAECGDYRTGFVATFRKYEGRPTDEKDKQGRPVKVTQRSFARHAGIDETTFHRWVKRALRGAAPARDRDRTRESIKRMPAEQKAQLVSEIIDELPNEEVREIREKVAGPSQKLKELQRQKAKREADTPEHERKGAEARLEEFRHSVMEKLSGMRSPLAYIESAIEEVRWFVSEDLEMEDEDEIVRRYIELGRELQVYGVRHDIDTAALDEALAAITKE